MAEMNFNKEREEGAELLRLTTDNTITHEAGEEFSLPDYVPEIRKLLHTKVGVLPESKYIGDEGAGSFLELGGTLTYLLIYTDDEGNLCSLPLTSAYEARGSLMGHPTTVFADTVVDSVATRVNAPRKITVKARLKSRIQGWESVWEGEKIENKSTADELFIERNVQEIKNVEIKALELNGIKVSDKLDTQGKDGLRPVWCDASAIITEARAQNNSVSVRGEINVKCICESGGERVTLTKDIMLAEEIAAEGATLGDMASVYARCVSLAISNEQSDRGEELFFDLTLDLDGELVRNGDRTLTKDCYSTNYETEESYKTIDTYAAVKAQSCSFTVSESVKRKSKDLNRIIDVFCDPVCEKAEIKGGNLNVVGKLTVTVLGEEGEAEASAFMTENYEIPFKYSLDAEGAQDVAVRARCTVGNVNARQDGERLYINGEIGLSLNAVGRTRLEIIDTCQLKKDKAVKKDAGCVRVCFPKEGDTLWEIAKRYHVTMERIRQQNSLSDNEVESIRNLII